MIKIIIILLLLIVKITLSKEQLNLYSARQEVLMRPLVKIFEEDTNIKVNIISAKANQLINRIEQEGSLPKQTFFYH